MVYLVICIMKRHASLINVKMWNNKLAHLICNELWNLRANQHAANAVDGTWQPVRVLESGCRQCQGQILPD